VSIHSKGVWCDACGCKICDAEDTGAASIDTFNVCEFCSVRDDRLLPKLDLHLFAALLRLAMGDVTSTAETARLDERAREWLGRYDSAMKK
jgi:hypothetical protein